MRVRAQVGTALLLPALCFTLACARLRLPFQEWLASVADLEGEVVVLHAGAEPPELGPVVIYLKGEPGGGQPPAPEATVRSGEAGFAPRFLAVGPGETIRVDNPGPLQHELFAVSMAGRIPVSLGPESTVEIEPPHGGPLHFYCKMHAEEHFRVYVAPTRWFALLGDSGAWKLEDVPAGEYTLTLWSEAVEGPVRSVVLRAGETARETIWLDARLLSRR